MKVGGVGVEVRAATYGVGLEALHEDAVQERDDGLDGLESSLSGLGRMSAWLQCGKYYMGERAW